jgi:hypothetical protein
MEYVLVVIFIIGLRYVTLRFMSNEDPSQKLDRHNEERRKRLGGNK